MPMACWPDCRLHTSAMTSHFGPILVFLRKSPCRRWLGAVGSAVIWPYLFGECSQEDGMLVYLTDWQSCGDWNDVLTPFSGSWPKGNVSFTNIFSRCRAGREAMRVPGGLPGNARLAAYPLENPRERLLSRSGYLGKFDKSIVTVKSNIFPTSPLHRSPP